MDQSHVRSTKRVLRQKRIDYRELTIDPNISTNISIEELNTAVLAVKSGKTVGFDGVYPEFIKNSIQRTTKWIVALFNNILTSGIIPKLFKRAKVIMILILKPGKDGSGPSCTNKYSRRSVWNFHIRPQRFFQLIFKKF
jgi:hypothetical protein